MESSSSLKNNISIHLYWIIFILVMLVIFIFSLRIGTNDSVKDIINTSLSVASLMLALVAIIQAIISGGGLSSSIVTLRSEISQIKDPAEKILAASEALKSHSENIDISFKNLDSRISVLNKLSTQESGPIGDSDSPFEKTTTIGGSATIYLCIKSLELKRRFNVNDVFDEDVWPKYIAGYIEALIFAGTLEAEKKEETYLITNIKSIETDTFISKASKGKIFRKNRAVIDKYFDDNSDSI